MAFTDEFPAMTGRFVKECDRDRTRDIRDVVTSPSDNISMTIRFVGGLTTTR